MSTLLFLGDEDFFLSTGKTGNNILCTRVNKPVLVLFYSRQCIYCKKLVPIFKKMPQLLGHTMFAMVNVGQVKETIQKSTSTKTSIEFVPYIIYYINNKPYLRYKGPPELENIKTFCEEVHSTIRSKNFFSAPATTNRGNNQQMYYPDPQVQDVESHPPKEYCIGNPLYGDDEEDKCYLNFDAAYDDELKPGQKGDVRIFSHHTQFRKAYSELEYNNYAPQQRKNINPYMQKGPPQQQRMERYQPPQQNFNIQDYRSMYSHPSEPINLGKPKQGGGYARRSGINAPKRR